MNALESGYDEVTVRLDEHEGRLFVSREVRGPVPFADVEPLNFDIAPSLIGAVYDDIALRGRGASLRSNARFSDATRDLGAQLFTAIFATRVGRLYHETIARAERNNRSVRIRIVVDGTMAAQLPWEMLFDPVTNDFLALGRGLAVVRTARAMS